MSAYRPGSSVEDIAQGMIIGDHFVITRKLGAGGMGDVFLAENLNLPDKRYAIKVLRRELSSIDHYEQLLKGEAQSQARLEHENIVQLYDYFRWQQRYCLVLAFVDGTTLADLIAAEPDGLQEAKALDLMSEVLKGVNHAHEHGVLHCDIKPANVLVDKDQRVRVTDFGIARDIGSASGVRGVVVGTPEYMSPEQISDPDRVDHRTDVYSAGVLLFEMLTGRLPFALETEGGIQYPQLSADPADIRDYRKQLSPDLARIVATALQRAPADRFQGCMDFHQAIIRYRQRQRWRRTWLPAIVAASVLAVTGAYGGYLWKQAMEEKAAEERRAVLAKAAEERRAVLARAAEERRLAEAKAAEEKKANEAAARTAIEGTIATAITQLGTLCRESQRLTLRKKSLATAAAAGFEDLVPNLKRQIEQLDQNISDSLRGYADQVGQLATFDPPVVKEVLGVHPKRDEVPPAYVQAIGVDHAALSAQRAIRSDKELQSICQQ